MSGIKFASAQKLSHNRHKYTAPRPGSSPGWPIVADRRSIVRPAKDLAELIAWLKANPGKAAQGHRGVGSVMHVAGVLIPERNGHALPVRAATLHRLCDGRHSGDALIVRGATHGIGRNRDMSRPGCNGPQENTQKSGLSACGSGATP
jgi:hypothetical protein